MYVCMYRHTHTYGVTVSQPTTERVSQPAGRGNIIATNLTLILADKNQKIPARVSISYFNNRFDKNTPSHNFLLYLKTFLSKKITDLKFSVHQSEKFSVFFSANSYIFFDQIFVFLKKDLIKMVPKKSSVEKGKGET